MLIERLPLHAVPTFAVARRAAVRVVAIATVAAAALVTGCRDGITLFEAPPPNSAHERYAQGLERAGLAETALGRDWVTAAASAIRQPLTVALPFQEAGYFSASEARAVGYAV